MNSTRIFVVCLSMSAKRTTQRFLKSLTDTHAQYHQLYAPIGPVESQIFILTSNCHPDNCRQIVCKPTVIGKRLSL